MQAKVIGYSWKPDNCICPRLTTAIEDYRAVNQTTRMFRYPYWVLDYTFTYWGRYRVRHKYHRWRERLPQTAHLYPPNMRYWENMRQEKQALTHNAYILFAGGEKAGLTQMIAKCSGYAVFHDPGGILGDLLKKMAVIGQSQGAAGYWKAQAGLYDVIDLLHCAKHIEAENYRIEPVDVPPAEPDLAKQVDQYLRQNASSHVNLAGIARHAGMSVSSLSHSYHEETGQTPMQTLANIRINLTKSFLMKGYSLKSIAEQLGFSDAFHLSKTFKRIEGISPRKFIKGIGKASAQ